MFRRREAQKKKNTDTHSRRPLQLVPVCVCVCHCRTPVQYQFDCDGEQLSLCVCVCLCVSQFPRNFQLKDKIFYCFFLFTAVSFRFAPLISTRIFVLMVVIGADCRHIISSPVDCHQQQQLSRWNGHTDARSDSAGCSHLSRSRRSPTATAQRAQRSQLQSGTVPFRERPFAGDNLKTEKNWFSIHLTFKL